MPEYIEREELLRRIDMVADTIGLPGRRIIKEIVFHTPAADVAPVVHGRWENGCVCSNCTTHCGPRNETAAIYYRYCSFCGAKMDGVERNGHD